MENEFDYGQTGAVEGQAVIWIYTKAKDGKFQIGKDGPEASTFKGRLTNFKVRWIAEPGHEDIPPHWEYILYLKAMDKTEGVVKDYAMTFSSHWRNPATSNMLNGLAGMIEKNPAWTGGIEIGIWISKPKNSTRGLLNCKLRDLAGADFPNKFPWDETSKSFVGVPKIQSEGVYDAPSFSAVNDFYKNVADQIAMFFGNEAGSKSGPSQSSQATPPPSAPAPAAPQQAGQIDKAIAFFKKSCENVDPSGIIEAGKNTLTLALKKPEKDRLSPSEMLDLTRKMVGIGISMGMPAGTWEIKDGAALWVPKIDDDLPF